MIFLEQFEKAKTTVQRERDLRLEAKSFEAAARTNWSVFFLLKKDSIISFPLDYKFWDLILRLTKLPYLESI